MGLYGTINHDGLSPLQGVKGGAQQVIVWILFRQQVILVKNTPALTVNGFISQLNQTGLGAADVPQFNKEIDSDGDTEN